MMTERGKGKVGDVEIFGGLATRLRSAEGKAVEFLEFDICLCEERRTWMRDVS